MNDNAKNSTEKNGSGQPEEEFLTVSQLTLLVKDAIESKPALRNLRVRGEISNFTRHSNNNLYFSLKDRDSQVRAVMFSRYAATLRFAPAEGDEVIALGSISVYEKRGEYQIYVRHMQPAGRGALFLEYLKLKKKLEEEGLFAPELKKPLPVFPRRIAVVTSPTGAAVRDVINIITRRFPAVEVTVSPTLVQGDQAAPKIRAALARAAALPGVDVILVVRGGGSFEDLWCFNDEALARDVAACHIPIISGVGHETDETLIDFVADLRAPTPSAAAEIAVPDIAELRIRLRTAQDRLARRLFESARFNRNNLKSLAAAMSPRRLVEKIDHRRQSLDDCFSAMKKDIDFRIITHRRQLENEEKRLGAVDPRRVLERGYAIVADKKTGNVIRSVGQVANGRLYRVSLHDGDFPARAEIKPDSGQTALDLDD